MQKQGPPPMIENSTPERDSWVWQRQQLPYGESSKSSLGLQGSSVTEEAHRVGLQSSSVETQKADPMAVCGLNIAEILSVCH